MPSRKRERVQDVTYLKELLKDISEYSKPIKHPNGKYIGKLVQYTPFEPFKIKTELEENDLKQSIKDRFKRTLVKGILSLKPFAKLGNFNSSTSRGNLINVQIKEESNTTDEEDSGGNTNKTGYFVDEITKPNIPQNIVSKQEWNWVNEIQSQIDPNRSFKSDDIDAEIKAITKKILTAQKKRNKSHRAPPTQGKAMYYCHVCNDNQKLTVVELKAHFVRHGMPEAANSASHVKKARAKQNRVEKPEVHVCEICSKYFSNGADLLQHLNNHEDQFFCDTCKAGFKTIIEHTCHVQLHSEDNLFRCPLCEFTTDKRGKIREHLYTLHEQFRKYKCDICNKGFSIYTYLQEHKNFHTGKKPFQCDQCGQCFMYTRYLYAHKMHNHAKYPPLECRVCKKICRTKKNLRIHSKIHDTSSNYICDVCGKTFKMNRSLAKHRIIHSANRPYKCRHCGKGFRQVSSRIDHERIHTGEKPHKCPHCGRGFIQRTSMVRHSLGHTGERPYICHLCKKGFIAKSVLLTHLQKSCEGWRSDS